MINTIIALIAACGTYATALMFGTIGEILTEKSGNLNLGVEGIMYLGGVMSLVAANRYEAFVGEANSIGAVAILISFIAAFIVGALAGLIFSFLTVTLRANQNVTGLAMTTFGTGAAKFIGEYMSKVEGGYVSVSNHLKEAFRFKPFPEFIRNIPVLGKTLFGQPHFFYFCVIIAVLMHYFLKNTKKGLYLRAVGESPATADSAGINISRYKYLATMIGGGISALGGMAYTMTTAGCVWNESSLSGVGWLSVALVIFCTWKPIRGIFGSLLFGSLMILYLWVILPFFPTELYKIIPYVVTIIVLIVASTKNIKEKQPPANLGNNFFREDR